MSQVITSGKWRTYEAKVYDRLRKRSLRAIDSYRGWQKMMGREYSLFLGSTDEWSAAEHEAYVAGVRDALNAMYDG